MATQTTLPGRQRRGLRRWVHSAKRAVTTRVGEDRFLSASTAIWMWRNNRRHKQLVMIHTMGKVGSTTIAASLRACGVRQATAMYQPHFVSAEGMAFAERLAIEGVGSWEKLARKERRGLLRNRLLNRELGHKRAAGERVKVITLVRDPVATNLSGLFHNYAWWPRELKARCAETAPACLEALGDYFLNHYPQSVPETWFDMEVKPLYGIDVYAQPFDAQRGYAIYRNEFADVLVLKLEKLNACAPAAFREFMGLDDFRLVESNTADDKTYADLYKAFRRDLALPADYLERMYGSRYARHFYSAEELAAFRGKWQHAAPPAG